MRHDCVVGAEVVVVADALPHAALGRGGPGLEAARALVVEPRARLHRDPRDLLVHVPLVEALRLLQKHVEAPLAATAATSVAAVGAVAVVAVLHAANIDAGLRVLARPSQVLDSDDR